MGVDVGAGDIEVDIIYITFIMNAQYTGYLVLYKDKVRTGNARCVYRYWVQTGEY